MRVTIERGYIQYCNSLNINTDGKTKQTVDLKKEIADNTYNVHVITHYNKCTPCFS